MKIGKSKRLQVFKRDNFICCYCKIDLTPFWKEPTTRYLVTLDHKYPKSRGGGKKMKNLVTSCLQCNMIKGNRTLEEFVRDQQIINYSQQRMF